MPALRATFNSYPTSRHYSMAPAVYAGCNHFQSGGHLLAGDVLACILCNDYAHKVVIVVSDNKRV